MEQLRIYISPELNELYYKLTQSLPTDVCRCIVDLYHAEYEKKNAVHEEKYEIAAVLHKESIKSKKTLVELLKD
jgi:hypothetical protein